MKKIVIMGLSFLGMAMLAVSAAVVPGVWNKTDFNAVKDYSDANHLPMVAFLGATKCDHCQTLIDTAIESQTFKTWQKDRALAMSFTEAEGTIDAIKSKPAYAWFKANGPAGSIPLIGVYWPKADGSTVVKTFCGRSGEMPVTKGTLVRQLIDSIESVIADYGKYAGGTFAVPGTEGSHYEAEIGRTAWVDVRLVREKAGAAASNTLVVRTNGVERTEKIVWSAAATDAVVRVAVPTDLNGDIALKLLDGAGGVVTNSAIRAVAPQATSRENPLWLGERDATGANALGAAEWTMDVETAFARTKAQPGEAWTVAYCAGSLWCPDCHGFATNFLDKSVFTDWAKAHNVALALVDMPRGSEFGGNPVGTPTLVSYEACNKPGKNDNGKSGAAYLSRKMVTVEAAKAVFDRNHTLTHETWYKNCDKAPRTGKSGLDVTLIPTMILFDKDGNIVSKLSGSRYLPNATTFTADEYMRRLDEMLAMANDAAHGVEGANNDWSTTKDEMTAQGSFDGTLSAGDGIPTEETEAHHVVDYVKLAGLTKGVKETLTVRSDDGKDAAVKVAIVTVKNGRETTLAETSGTLAAGVSVTASVATEDACYARLLGDDPFGVFALSNKTSSVRGYRLSGAVTLVPQVSASSIVLEKGSATMEIAAGTVYRLTASVGTVEASDLTDLGDGLYRADSAATSATVTVATGVQLTYQIWQTGTVGFASAASSIKEGTSDKTLDIVFTRAGGSSGRAELEVNVVGGTAENGIRYEWPTDERGVCVPQSVVWEDGDATDKTLALTILADSGYDGDETALLEAASADGSVASLGLANMTVTILEVEKKASAGKIGFVSDQEALVKKGTAYAVEDTELALLVERADGTDGAVVAEVACSVASAEAAPALLEWPKRTGGAQETVVRVPSLSELGGKTSFRVTLSGPQVLSSAKSVTVNVLPADGPRFEETERELSLTQYIAADAEVGVIGLSGSGRVTVTKLAGSVPSGLSMKLRDGAFAISGVPTKAGEWTSVWQVKEGTVRGGLLHVVCSVASFGAPVEEGGVGALASLLPSGTKRATYSGIAFCDGGLYGTLSLTLSGKGAMTLACETALAKKSFSTGGWTSTDGAGVLSLEAAAKTGETVGLTVSADDGGKLRIEGTLDDPEAGEATLYFPTHCAAWSSANPATDYVGSYTACLRNEARERAGAEEFRAMAKGDGYLTLSMKATAAKKGAVSWTGQLPNGTSVYGTSTLVPYDDGTSGKMLLALLRRSTTDGFAALVTIDPPGERSGGVPADNQLIAPFDETPGVWSHRARGYASASFDAPLSVYGGYYGTDLDLAACARSGDGTAEYEIVADVSALEPDGKLGESAVGPEGRTVTVGANALALSADKADRTKLTLKFNKSTGVASGTFKLTGESGSTVTATWRGVVLPGWQEGCPECGAVVLPFLSGGAYFTDKMPFESDAGRTSSLSVKQGLHLFLKNPERP